MHLPFDFMGHHLALGVPRVNKTQDRARRIALFLSILMSGGLLIFPRLPILVLLIPLTLLAAGFQLPTLERFSRIYIVLGVILIVFFLRPGTLDFESLLIRFANFVCALFLLSCYLNSPVGAFANDLYYILRLMAFQAIGTALLAVTLGGLFYPVESGDVPYKTILLIFTYSAITEETSRFVRPTGFFFEPGVFQMYLNIYLYLALFVFRSVRQSVLGVFAVLSTQSTTGVFLLAMILGVAFFNNFSKRSIGNQVLGLLLIAVVAPPLVLTVMENANEKIHGEYRGSSAAREFDLYTGLAVIKENPLLGIGFSHDRYLEASRRLGYFGADLSVEDAEERPTSNGLLYLVYTLGIPISLVLFVAIFLQGFFRHRWIIGFLLAASLSTEAIIYTPFVMAIIFSGFVPLGRAILGGDFRRPAVFL